MVFFSEEAQCVLFNGCGHAICVNVSTTMHMRCYGELRLSRFGAKTMSKPRCKFFQIFGWWAGDWRNLALRIWEWQHVYVFIIQQQIKVTHQALGAWLPQSWKARERACGGSVSRKLSHQRTRHLTNFFFSHTNIYAYIYIYIYIWTERESVAHRVSTCISPWAQQCLWTSLQWHPSPCPSRHHPPAPARPQLRQVKGCYKHVCRDRWRDTVSCRIWEEYKYHHEWQTVTQDSKIRMNLQANLLILPWSTLHTKL